MEILWFALSVLWLLGYGLTLWAKYIRTEGLDGIDLKTFVFTWPFVLTYYFFDTRRVNRQT